MTRNINKISEQWKTIKQQKLQSLDPEFETDKSNFSDLRTKISNAYHNFYQRLVEEANGDYAKSIGELYSPNNNLGKLVRAINALRDKEVAAKNKLENDVKAYTEYKKKVEAVQKDISSLRQETMKVKALEKETAEFGKDVDDNLSTSKSMLRDAAFGSFPRIDKDVTVRHLREVLGLSLLEPSTKVSPIVSRKPVIEFPGPVISKHGVDHPIDPGPDPSEPDPIEEPKIGEPGGDGNGGEEEGEE